MQLYFLLILSDGTKISFNVMSTLTGETKMMAWERQRKRVTERYVCAHARVCAPARVCGEGDSF